MPDNRPFSAQQDKIIKQLYENEKITKWAMIARKLTQEYNFPRNAKQCRDRYQQYLDPLVLSVWTPEEQQKLFQLHDKIGNKWAVIAHQFPGKTDNIVKNHFYSKLRKSMRRMNKIINKNFKKEFKELNIKIIYKVIEAFQEQFKENPVVQKQISQHCMSKLLKHSDLKNSLLEYSNDNENDEMMDEDFSRERSLLMKIYYFNRNYKRKSKKQRRNSIQVSELFKVPERRFKGTSDQQESQSEFSFPISHQQNADSSASDGSNKSPKLLVVVEEDELNQMNEEGEMRESQNSKIDIRVGGKDGRESLMSSGKISQQKSNSVQEMLRGSAALEVGRFQNIYKAQVSHKSFSNRSQYQKIDMFGNFIVNEDEIRFSGGSKNMYLQESYEDSLRFSGGLRLSGGLRRSNQMIEEDKQLEDLHRSHR